jgi:carboxyl-terminal processing protease
MDGNLEGIGAEVTAIDGDIIIVAPFEGSPAEKAGIQSGDILRSADGVDLTGLHPSEAAGLVRGPKGTSVSLEIERDGELLVIEVTRGVINIPSVRGEMVEEDVAYIRLSRFGNGTGKELVDVLQLLSVNDPIGYVLDLRSNPGGSLSAAVDVADQFLDDGTILLERFGNGDEKTYESDGSGDAQELPLVILINQGSASASEVIAGAVRDRDRGILIGERSFGKGTVQSWEPLSNGGGVRITIARWLTPDGQWVNEEGLEPDIIVSPSESDQEEMIDVQLQEAIEYLRGRSILESESSEDG